MDANTLRRNGELLLDAAGLINDDFLLHLGLGLDGIKRPLLLGVLSGDLLHGCSEETLRVVEASEPEGDGALALREPVIELVVPVDEALDPATERRREPRDLFTGFNLPLNRHALIVDHVNSVDEVSSHDNGTINGGNHIGHGFADNSKDVLELLDLLFEEVGQRHNLVRVKSFRNGHHRQLFLVFRLDEVRWQLLDQVLLKSVLDLIFLCPACATTGILRHRIDQGVDHAQRLVETIGQISGGVETEDDWRVLLRERLDVLLVLLDLGVVGDNVREFRVGHKVVVLLIEDLG